jgi:hypothetical protein
MQTLANRSRLKSDKLSAVEDGARQFQAKEHQLREKAHRIVNLRNELNTIKQEHN